MAQLEGMPPNVLRQFFIANLNSLYKQAFRSVIPDTLEECVCIARRQKLFRTENETAQKEEKDSFKDVLNLMTDTHVRKIETLENKLANLQMGQDKPIQGLIHK